MTVGGVTAGGDGGEDPSQSAADAPARVLVVGSGFAGLHTARALERTLPAGKARITLVSPTDYMLYPGSTVDLGGWGAVVGRLWCCC